MESKLEKYQTRLMLLQSERRDLAKQIDDLNYKGSVVDCLKHESRYSQVIESIKTARYQMSLLRRNLNKQT